MVGAGAAWFGLYTDAVPQEVKKTQISSCMDYYEILGVLKPASPRKGVKTPYKKKVCNTSDRTGGDDSKSQEINEAYPSFGK